MNKITTFRDRARMSQKELADKMGMSVAAWGRRERGEVSLSEEEIKKLVELLGCTFDEYFGGKRR